MSKFNTKTKQKEKRNEHVIDHCDVAKVKWILLVNEKADFVMNGSLSSNESIQFELSFPSFLFVFFLWFNPIRVELSFLHKDEYESSTKTRKFDWLIEIRCFFKKFFRIYFFQKELNKQKEEFDEDNQNVDIPKTHKALASIQLKKVPAQQAVLYPKTLNSEVERAPDTTIIEQKRREQGKNEENQIK